MKPNQVPQAPADHQHRPEYVMPGPARVQRAALRLASVAMGGEHGTSPHQVMDKFVTEVGGYEPGKEDARYAHRDGFEKGSRMVALSADETTKGNNHGRMYASGSDFDESAGQATLDLAVARTVRGERSTTTKKGPVTRVRHTVARKLVGKAVKGISTHGWEA